MPADLQRAFLYEIAPALQKGEVAGRLVDVVVLAKVRSLLSDADADMERPIRVPNSINEAVIHGLAGMENVTKGARDNILKARNLSQAMAAVFGDKQFRAYLRSNTVGDIGALNSLISKCSDLAAAAVIEPPAMGKPRLAPKTAKSRAAARTLDGRYANLANLTFHYRLGKTLQASCVAELVGLLCDPEAERDRVEAQLSSLARSSLSFCVPLLLNMDAAGGLRIAPQFLPMLRTAGTRIYLGMNAIRSAAALGEAVLEDPEQLMHLSAGEQLRLRNLVARCAMRSGRGTAAVEMYTDILAENPRSPGALMNVVGSAFSLQPAVARNYGKVALINNMPVSDSDLVFIGDLLISGGDHEWAEAAFFRLAGRSEDAADAFVGLANLSLARADRQGWRRFMRRYFAKRGGGAVGFDDLEDIAPFAVVKKPSAVISDHPRITVVMTTFNAASTVERAVQSVLAQGCQNFELIIVDDRSEDDTPQILKALSESDHRIRILINDSNIGTYVSKNRGIEIADGEYVTFHDSDDWMHPDRLLHHLRAMDEGHACTTSEWLRMEADGRIVVRRGGPYTHLNPASTFIRREVFDRIGAFDAVRTGADAEMLSRVRMSGGDKAVLGIDKCLALGLHHENSLTQSGVAAFDEFRYSPVRLEYTEAWVQWQIDQLASKGHVALDRKDDAHPFAIPSALSPSPTSFQEPSP